MIQGKQQPKSVLIFNSKKTLTLIAASIYEASKYSGLKPGNISMACNGQKISANKYYFRYISEEVEIELEDIGTLKLDDYDKLCGIKRQVYETSKMNRKNWKYKTNTINDGKN